MRLRTYLIRGKMGRIEEYDKKRQKHLLVILPISLLILVIILISMEKTGVVRKYFTVGFRGPMKIVPEIEIVDETGLEDVSDRKKKRTMIAQNVKIEGEKSPEEEKGKKPSSPEKKSGKNNLKGSSTTDDLYRSYPSRAVVPYREDYVILKMVKPQYPPDALELGLEGYVLVELYVDETGEVAGAWVRSSYGPLSFEKSALEAVRRFRFQPVREDGKPVPFWVSFLIKFRLKY